MWLFSAVWCFSSFAFPTFSVLDFQPLSDVRAAGRLRELVVEVEWFMRVCRSMYIKSSSRGTYESHHRIFLDCCDAFGVDPLDLNEDDLAKVVCHFAMGHTVTSVSPYLSAIQNFYDVHGSGKLRKDAAFVLTCRGLRRLLGPADSVVRTKAVSMEELRAIVVSLDKLDAADCCFAAQIIVAFFLTLRTEDHVAGRLRWGDVFPQTDGSVEFLLPPGKSCREFRTGALVARPDELDALTWLGRLARHVPAARRGKECPVFVSFARTRSGTCNYWAVSRTGFIDRFKDKVKSVLGFSPALYAGYSLRRGGLTAMLSAERPPPLPAVKRHGGWAPTSEAYNKYFDNSGYTQLRLPSAALL